MAEQDAAHVGRDFSAPRKCGAVPGEAGSGFCSFVSFWDCSPCDKDLEQRLVGGHP